MAGVAEHINKFWEPRMRRQFFEMVDGGGEGLLPIVLEAAAQVRRPSAPVTPEQAGARRMPDVERLSASVELERAQGRYLPSADVASTSA